MLLESRYKRKQRSNFKRAKLCSLFNWPAMLGGGSGIAGVNRGSYDGKSLVLDGDVDYATCTLGAPTDADIWTLHFRVKRHETGRNQYLFTAHTANSDAGYGGVSFDSSDRLTLEGWSTVYRATSMRFRDVHHWYDICVSWDHGTIVIEVDNVTISTFDTSNTPAQDNFGAVNSATQHAIGVREDTLTTDNANISLAAFDFIDGTIKAASDFGEVSADTDKWVLKNYTGSYGGNDFCLDFNDDRATNPDTTSILYDQSSKSSAVSNGGFDSDTVWSKQTGCTISGGVGSYDGTQSPAFASFYQDSLTTGVTYRITYTVSNRTAGQFRVAAGLGGLGVWRSANGTYEEYITCATNTVAYCQGDGDFIGDIDDVSFIPVHNWTGNSLTTDSFTNDTPVDNFCTLSPLNVSRNSSNDFNNGNTQWDNTAATASQCGASIFFDVSNSDLDIYWEVTCNDTPTVGAYPGAGGCSVDKPIMVSGSTALDTSQSTYGGFKYSPNGNFSVDGTVEFTGSSVIDGTILGFHVQGDSVEVFHDGTSQGTATIGGINSKIIPAMDSFGSRAMTFNFGATDFTHKTTNAPNANTLSSAGLPTPNNWKPQGVADFKTATGANIDSELSGFDIHIIKDRDTTEKWVIQFNHDSSNQHSWAATTNAAGVYESAASFSGSENHFGLGLNNNGTDVIAGSATFAGGDLTITDNAGNDRKVILIFNRSGGEIYMYHPDLTSGDLLRFNNSAGETAATNIKSVTSNGFTLDYSDYGSSNITIDYLVLVEGDVFDLFNHVGNGNSDGAFITMDGAKGLFAKRIDATASSVIFDKARDADNPAELHVYTNYPGAPAEGTSGNDVDILSNGLKLRDAGNAMNANTGSYVGFAIKENGGQLAA